MDTGLIVSATEEVMMDTGIMASIGIRIVVMV
jgi:hypothetical protein